MTEDELVDFLRSKTHFCRFAKGEVREVLAFLRDHNLLKAHDKPAEKSPV